VTSYELWLFLHIAASMVWIGGAVAAQVFAVLAKRSGDPARTAAFGRDLAFVGPKVFLPAAVVVLVTGGLLTEDGSWGWDEPFIVFGLVGWTVIAATAFGYITRAMGRAGARMAAEGPSPEVLRQINRLVLLARIMILLLFAIVFMMVAKIGT
jgi:uncharacterized membrane protein